MAGGGHGGLGPRLAPFVVVARKNISMAMPAERLSPPMAARPKLALPSLATAMPRPIRPHRTGKSAHSPYFIVL